MEFSELSEFSIKLSEDNFSINKIFIILLSQRLTPNGVQKLIFLIIFHCHKIDSSLEVRFSLSLHSVGRISEYSIMLIRADKRIDCVFWLLEKRMLIMSICFAQWSIVGNLVLTHILPPELIEIRRIVVHLWREFIAKSYQLKNLSAVHASLEGAFT